MNKNIVYLKSVPSTQNFCKHLIEQHHVKQATAVLAQEQTQGRGQFNRDWISLSGNLHLSIMLPFCVEKMAGRHYQLGVIVALAVRYALCDALKNSIRIKHSIPSIQLKWPNDGIINDRKLFGVLIEYFDGYMIVGIGININIKPTPSTRFSAITLKEACSIKQNIDVATVAPFVIKRVVRFYQLWIKHGLHPSLRKLWLRHAYHLGSMITHKNSEGLFHSIDDAGYMVLKTKEGEFIKVTS